MNTKYRLPIIKKTSGREPEKTEQDLSAKGNYSGQHVGSSDAFSKTENTASPDADNVSDEKLDDLIGGD